MITSIITRDEWDIEQNTAFLNIDIICDADDTEEILSRVSELLTDIVGGH